MIGFDAFVNVEYSSNFGHFRTQTDYDNALTLKSYLFQFVNFYSSIFYIAFIKGSFAGTPDDYNRLFGDRQASEDSDMM